MSKERHSHHPKERVDGRECIVTHLHDLRDIDLTQPQWLRLALQLKEIDLYGIPCSLQMSRHHIRYECEGGSDNENNKVDCCMGHQRFIHSSYVWSGVDFSFLLNKGKRRRYD